MVRNADHDPAPGPPRAARRSDSASRLPAGPSAPGRSPCASARRRGLLRARTLTSDSRRAVAAGQRLRAALQATWETSGSFNASSSWSRPRTSSSEGVAACWRGAHPPPFSVTGCIASIPTVCGRACYLSAILQELRDKHRARGFLGVPARPTWRSSSNASQGDRRRFAGRSSTSASMTARLDPGSRRALAAVPSDWRTRHRRGRAVERSSPPSARRASLLSCRATDAAVMLV